MPINNKDRTHFEANTRRFWLRSTRRRPWWSLWKRYREYGVEYRERCERGLPMTEVLVYQSGLRAMEREIQGETKQLEQLRERAEAKRKEVVEAKQETAAIEKLKEKRCGITKRLWKKSEEGFIEELSVQAA